jgi:SAM-dependent methyltransferase
VSDDSQREFWNRRADAWERRALAVDAFSDEYGMPAIEALAVRPGERIVDIGCGPGTTTMELARRVAPDGVVVGVDISDRMIAAARRRSDAAGIGNVTFEVADAGVEPLGEGVDAVFSRFGVMFFPAPADAFANIATALRPGGRAAFAVWAALGENPWMFLPTMLAAGVLATEPAIPAPGAPGPFSLADPDEVVRLLGGAGFVDVDIEPLTGTRVIADATAADDVAVLLEVGPLGEAYEAADEATRDAAIAAIIDGIGSYREDSGWRLPGRAQLITARRAS